MAVQQGFSRRQLLAAGALIVGSGHRAFSQAARRIEQFAPELDAIISTSEPIEELAGGTGGTLGPTEGPLWWKEGGYLLYSDIHNNRRMKYLPGQGVSVAQETVNRSNGLTRDMQGRLVICERVTRRVVRQELDGSITVLANTFQGRQLNIAQRRYRQIGRCDLFQRSAGVSSPSSGTSAFPGSIGCRRISAPWRFWRMTSCFPTVSPSRPTKA